MNKNELAIAKIDEQCRVLASLRNTHVAIAKLPNEVLLCILTMYKHQIESDTKEQHAQNDTPWQYSYSWIVASHICHHWRMVTLESPTFWSPIYAAIPQKGEWAKELLARANNAPDTLALQLPSNQLSSWLLHNGALRPMRHLQLAIFPSTGDPEPQIDHAQLRGPSLLPLNSLNEVTIWDRTGYLISHELLADFFATLSPHLQAINLFIQKNRSGNPPPTPLCHILASFDQLQNLTLSRVYEVFFTRSDEPIAVAFPHLQSLSLEDDYLEAYVDVFTWVKFSFPPSARIAIKATGLLENESVGNLCRMLCELEPYQSHSSASSQRDSGCTLSIFRLEESVSYRDHTTLKLALSVKADTENPRELVSIQVREVVSSVAPGICKIIADELQKTIHIFPSFSIGYRSGSSYDDTHWTQSVGRVFSTFQGLRTISVNANDAAHIF